MKYCRLALRIPRTGRITNEEVLKRVKKIVIFRKRDSWFAHFNAILFGTQFSFKENFCLSKNDKNQKQSFLVTSKENVRVVCSIQQSREVKHSNLRVEKKIYGRTKRLKGNLLTFSCAYGTITRLLKYDLVKIIANKDNGSGKLNI